MIGEEDDLYYIFIDEVQNVCGFESVIQAYAEEGYSVFLTGSNSYLLSDEISTKLTAMNTDNRLSYGPSLENMVYLYLVSHDYQVSIGRIGKLECDFIVRDKKQNYAYIQVTYTMQGENTEATSKIKEREYRPFRNIKDGYPRYIISLDRFRDQQEGVRHINAIDLFLGMEHIA